MTEPVLPPPSKLPEAPTSAPATVPPSAQAQAQAQAKAQAILGNPSATLGVGGRAPGFRRVASFWQKTKYVLTPVLVTPMAVGVVGTAGFLLAGAGAAAIMPGVNLTQGLVMGGMASAGIVTQAMAIMQVVGLFQGFLRLRVSRTELATRLNEKRMRRIQKDVARQERKTSRRLARP